MYYLQFNPSGKQFHLSHPTTGRVLCGTKKNVETFCSGDKVQRGLAWIDGKYADLPALLNAGVLCPDCWENRTMATPDWIAGNGSSQSKMNYQSRLDGVAYYLKSVREPRTASRVRVGVEETIARLQRVIDNATRELDQTMEFIADPDPEYTDAQKVKAARQLLYSVIGEVSAVAGHSNLGYLPQRADDYADELARVRNFVAEAEAQYPGITAEAEAQNAAAVA